MRIPMKVVGVGQRRKGVSKKTGQAYDMTEVTLLYKSKSVNGDAAVTAVLDGSSCVNLYPGMVVEAVCFYKDYRPYVVDIGEQLEEDLYV